MEMANAVCASSLLFAPGGRPASRALDAAAQASNSFGVSFDPGGESGLQEGWVELVANGLTFDLTGLAPGAPDHRPQCEYVFGMNPAKMPSDCEAITLVPGPHLTSGMMVFPVVRLLASLTAQLAGALNARSVAWHSARSCCAADYFTQGVNHWIEGGVFPGLGLTALNTNGRDGLESEGLALFTGQELQIPRATYDDPVEAVKVALRIVNWLVEHGRIDSVESFTGPDGAPLWLEPVENSAILRLWRGAPA